MLSLLEHTRVGLADNSERQDDRRCDARYDKRSDRGVWDFYCEYAGSDEWFGGVKQKRLRISQPFFDWWSK